MSFCFQLAKALRKGPYQTNLLLAGYDANEGENNSQIATNLIWQNTRNSNIFNFITTFISHFAIPGPPLEVFWIIFSLSLPFSLHLLSLSLTLSISLSLYLLCRCFFLSHGLHGCSVQSELRSSWLRRFFRPFRSGLVRPLSPRSSFYTWIYLFCFFLFFIICVFFICILICMSFFRLKICSIRSGVESWSAPRSWTWNNQKMSARTTYEIFDITACFCH